MYLYSHLLKMCQEIFNFSVNIISTLILKNSLYIWLSWRLFSFRCWYMSIICWFHLYDLDMDFLQCHDQFEGFLGVVCFYCNKAKLKIIAIWLHYKSWYLGLVVVVCNRIGVIMTHGSYCFNSLEMQWHDDPPFFFLHTFN